MNRFVHACALLFFLLSAPPASAFSQYGYLLETPDFSFASAALVSSCLPPLPSSLEGLPREKAADFQESLGDYDDAVRELRSANAYAFASRLPLVMPPLALAAQAMPLLCLQAAHASVRASARSVQAALPVLDADAAALENAQDNEQGFTQGVRLEVQEIRDQLRAGTLQGNAFAPRLLRASKALHALSPSSNLGLILQLAGPDSLLVDAFNLHARLRAALEDLQAQARDSAAVVRRETDSLKLFRQELEADKLPDVNDRALAFALKDEPVSSFPGAFAHARSLEREAAVLSSRADSYSASKERGALGRALRARQDALSRLQEAQDLLQSVQDAALDAQLSLEQRLPQRFEALASALKAKQGEPAAFALLAKLHEDYLALADTVYALQTTGEKVNRLLQMDETLSGLEALSQAKDAYLAAYADAQAGVDRLDSLLQKAREDAVDVASESRRLDVLNTALASLSLPSGDRAAGLVELKKQLQDLRETVLGKAASQYAYLEPQAALVEEFKDALSQEQQAKAEAWLRLFPNGKLDAEFAVGRLKELQAFFSQASSTIEVQAPRLVAQALAGSLRVETDFQAVELGQAATASIRVALENPLPFSVSEPLSVPLPIPAGRLELVQAPAGVHLGAANGKPALVFSNVGRQAYAAELRWTGAPVRVLEEKETTVYADEHEARKVWRVRFSSDHDGPIVLEKRLPFPAEFSVETLLPFEVQSLPSGIRVTVQAREGENAVGVSYAWKNPFTIETETETRPGGILLSYSVSNPAADLEGAKLNLLEALPCEIAAATAQSLGEGFFAKTEFQANALSLVLSVPSWPAGRQVHASVELQCRTSPADSIAAQLAALSIPANGTVPSDVQLLEEAGALYREGKIPESFAKLQAYALRLVPTITPTSAPEPSSEPAPTPAQITTSTPDPSPSASLSDMIDQANDSLALYAARFDATGRETQAKAVALYASAKPLAQQIQKSVAALQKDAPPLSAKNAVLASRLPSDVEQLLSYARDMDAQAAGALGAAAERQKQFGSPDTQAKLDVANALADQGHALSAFLAAGELSESLHPAQASALSTPWLWLLPGTVLAFLLYRLLWKNKGFEADENA